MSLGLAFAIALLQAQPSPAYTEENSIRLFYKGDVILSLGLGRHVPYIEDFKDYMHLGIQAQGDFDRDGVADAVVEVDLGGNACPGVSYVAISGGHIGVPFVTCTGESIQRESKADHDEFIVKEWSEGRGEKTARYRFQKGKMARIK